MKLLIKHVFFIFVIKKKSRKPGILGSQIIPKYAGISVSGLRNPDSQDF